MRLPVLSLLSFPLIAIAQAPPTEPLDTAAAIAYIEARMTAVDQAPIGAVFSKVSGREMAVRLWPDSALPAGEEERYELYVNPDGSVAGMGVYPRSTHLDVLESASHYFDENGNTVSAWFRMKWLDNGCTDSIAVETRFVYFYPPGRELLQYATLRDAKGNDLDGGRCRFPGIERRFETYYHRDLLLTIKHIPEN